MTEAVEPVATPEPASEPIAEAPAKPRRSRKKAAEPVEAAVPEPVVAEAPAAPAAEAEATPAPVRRRRSTKAAAAATVAPDHVLEPVVANGVEPTAPDAQAVADAGAEEAGPPRRGWWQRTFGA